MLLASKEITNIYLSQKIQTYIQHTLYSCKSNSKNTVSWVLDDITDSQLVEHILQSKKRLYRSTFKQHSNHEHSLMTLRCTARTFFASLRSYHRSSLGSCPIQKQRVQTPWARQPVSLPWLYFRFHTETHHFRCTIRLLMCRAQRILLLDRTIRSFFLSTAGRKFYFRNRNGILSHKAAGNHLLLGSLPIFWILLNFSLISNSSFSSSTSWSLHSGSNSSWRPSSWFPSSFHPTVFCSPRIGKLLTKMVHIAMWRFIARRLKESPWPRPFAAVVWDLDAQFLNVRNLRSPEYICMKKVAIDWGIPKAMIEGINLSKHFDLSSLSNLNLSSAIRECVWAHKLLFAMFPVSRTYWYVWSTKIL